MHPTFIRAYIFCLSIATALYAVALLIPAVRPYPAAFRPLADAPLSSSLAVVTAAERAAPADYQRERFGPGWAASGRCTVRHEVIGKQLAGTVTLQDCMPVGGEFFDPYAGKVESFTHPREVEVDHIFPLSAAWDLGAAGWSDAQRVQFANDPLNLVATSRKLNQDKLDQLPAQWMPPARAGHCWYATQLAAVAAKYHLALPPADQARMRRACWLRSLRTNRLG